MPVIATVSSVGTDWREPITNLKVDVTHVSVMRHALFSNIELVTVDDSLRIGGIQKFWAKYVPATGDDLEHWDGFMRRIIVRGQALPHLLRSPDLAYPTLTGPTQLLYTYRHTLPDGTVLESLYQKFELERFTRYRFGARRSDGLMEEMVTWRASRAIYWED